MIDNNRDVDLMREVLRLKMEKFIAWGLKMDYHPQIHGDTVVYGAGVLGKLLIRSFDTKPIAFWDSNVKKTDICGIKITNMEDGIRSISYYPITVIITPVWDYESIKSEINEGNSNIRVVSLEDLLCGI